MAVVQMCDGAKSQNAQHELGSSAETGRVVRVNSTDSDHKITRDQVAIYEYWRAERSASYLRQVTDGIMHQDPAGGCSGADLPCHHIQWWLPMHASCDKYSNLIRGYAGVL